MKLEFLIAHTPHPFRPEECKHPNPPQERAIYVTGLVPKSQLDIKPSVFWEIADCGQNGSLVTTHAFFTNKETNVLI